LNILPGKRKIANLHAIKVNISCRFPLLAFDRVDNGNFESAEPDDTTKQSFTSCNVPLMIQWMKKEENPLLSHLN
jgi:hypothetical protein